MTVDEIAKLLLAFSLSFSIFGISLQIVRLLGTVNAGLRAIQPIFSLLEKLVAKITDDYSKISDIINEVLKSIKSFNEPLAIIASMLKRFVKN